MPNWCYARISVTGRTENVEEFIKVLDSHYNYNTYEFTHKFHVYRTWLQDYDCEKYGLIMQADIYIECAWSVYVCMFDGPSSYYKSNLGGYNRAVTLEQLSKIYGLYIEVWSEEYGMMFEEHYKIINGKIVIEEEIDIGDSQFLGCDYEDYKDMYGDDAVLSESQYNEYYKYTNVYAPSYQEWEFGGNYIDPKPNHLVTMNMCNLIEK